MRHTSTHTNPQGMHAQTLPFVQEALLPYWRGDAFRLELLGFLLAAGGF